MRLLLLLLALQSQAPVRATAADSAVARAALRNGLAAFDSVSTDTDQQRTVVRYLEQLLVWNMKDEGGEAALRFDRVSTRAWRATSVCAAYWLWLMLDAGDTLTSERFIATIPPEVKDIQMTVAGQLLLGDTYFPPFRSNLPRVLWLESRISKPSQRAELIAGRAQFALPSDSTTGRAFLRQAIRLSQSDTTEMWYTWKWMITLLKLGDQIPMNDIVRAAMYAQGDLWSARQVVADELTEQGLSHLARPFTVAAGIERLEGVRPESRIAIHFLRATPRDSSLAWAIHDSLDAAPAAQTPTVPPPSAAERAARDAAAGRALAQLQAVEAMSRDLLGWRPRFNTR